MKMYVPRVPRSADFVPRSADFVPRSAEVAALPGAGRPLVQQRLADKRLAQVARRVMVSPENPSGGFGAARRPRNAAAGVVPEETQESCTFCSRMRRGPLPSWSGCGTATSVCQVMPAAWRPA